MFIGIDVYHQKAGKTNSVVGFVATRNPGASKYFSQTFDQGQREEIMTNNLRQATISAIQKFKEVSRLIYKKIRYVILHIMYFNKSIIMTGKKQYNLKFIILISNLTYINSVRR